MIVCELCGNRYEAADTALCSKCPLHSGCGLVCCPNCGYSTIASGGQVVSQGKKSLNGVQSRGRKDNSSRRLLLCPAGMKTTVRDFSAQMSDGNKLFLLGRGVRPGKSVRVLQNSPEVVIQVDHLQIALEKELARLITVD
jgi:Fe2+ transport system protein FeoA